MTMSAFEINSVWKTLWEWVYGNSMVGVIEVGGVVRLAGP